MRRPVACPVCGGPAGAVIDRKRTGLGMLTTVHCPGCGMVWSSPRPAARVYAAFYRGAYSKEVYGLSQSDASVDEVLRWRTRRSLEKISYFPGFWKRGAAVLEVGTGTGAFLAALRDQYGSRVWGIEPAPAFVRTARRLHLTVFSGSYDAWRRRPPAAFPRTYDRIVLDQVLEHILEPVSFLRSLVPLVRADGQLFISVPNIARPKDSRSTFFIFEHVSSFSPYPLALLLLRAGWKPTGIFEERPGSLQMTAAPLDAAVPMLSASRWGTPLTAEDIQSRFSRL